MSANFRLRPSRRAIALEPRLLFDGAGAVAGADALVDDPGESHVEHVPQTQNDEQDNALLNLFETMSDTDPTMATVGLSADTTEPLIGEDATLKLVFDNKGGEVGYGPFIELFIERKGVDGSTTDFDLYDGLEFKTAEYLGVSVTHEIYTLVDGEAGAGQLSVNGGTFTHPVTGEVVDIPAGFGAGDQLIILTLPFGSFTPDQPAAEIDVVLNVNNKADPGHALKVVSRGGYMFGTDALDNPDTDPAFMGNAVELSITPQAFTVTAELHAPEGETVTGPNFVREIEVTITPAAGTELSDKTIFEFKMPDGVIFVEEVFEAEGWEIVTRPTYDDSTENDALVLRRIDGQPLTSASVISIPFYVTEVLQTGNNVISEDGNAVDIDFSNAITVKDVAWTGVEGSNLDGTRDTLEVEAVSPAGVMLTARSVQVIKDTVYRVDGESKTSTSTVVPGDLLEYEVQVDISDFFRTGNVIVTDTLPDGLTFDKDYTPTLQVNWKDADGVSQTSNVDFDPENVEVKDGDNWVTLASLDGDELPTDPNTGETKVRFLLSQQLSDDGSEQLLGGLVDHASDATIGDQNNWEIGNAGTGGTTATIAFRAKVEENYRTETPLTGDNIDHQNLKERDVLGSQATVTVEILDRKPDDNNEHTRLADQDDDSSEAVSLPGGEMGLVIASITRDGETLSDPENQILAPGDVVTYRLEYTLPIGDYENLKFDAYLPMPVFELATGTMEQADDGSSPVSGQWSFGPGTTATVDQTTVEVHENNHISFVLGDSGKVPSGEQKIEIYFAATVTDNPFADRLLLTTQGQHEDSSSSGITGSTSAISQIVLGQADVHIHKGYTGVSDTQSGEVDYSTFTPGDEITSDTINQIGASNAHNLDGGDTVQVTIAVENRGSSARGAYDVQVKDSLDETLDDARDIIIYNGNGAVVKSVEIWDSDTNDWKEVTVADHQEDVLAALHGGDKGIRFVDADGKASLARGANDDGTVIADGSNIIYISYTATVKAETPVSSTGDSEAFLVGFANAEGATNFLTTPREDNATITYRDNDIGLVITKTDGHGDTDVFDDGDRADAVIGEFIEYKLTINLAEAKTTNGVITVDLGKGLGLVDVAGFHEANTTIEVQLEGFDDGESFIDGKDVTGKDSVEVTLDTVSANQFTIKLGDIINADNDDGDETITVTFRAIPLNTSDNTDNDTGASQRVTATFTSDDPGASPITEDVDITIREPKLETTISADKTTVSADETVTYTLTVTNTSDFAAHDVVIQETILEYLYDLEILPEHEFEGVTDLDDASNLDERELKFSIKKLDAGGKFTVTFTAKVAADTPFSESLKVEPTVTWTSLPGVVNNQSELVDGTETDSERTGGEGDVNNYIDSDDAIVIFAAPKPELVIDATSEPSTEGPDNPSSTADDRDGADVTIGEIVRLRMVVELPESTSNGVSIVPVLPDGLMYIDNSATIAFVSNGSDGGVSSSTLSGDSLQVTGANPDLVNPTFKIDPDGDGKFNLGTLDNQDRDSDSEYIVLEFNVRVQNIEGVSSQEGQNKLAVTYKVVANGVDLNESPESDAITLTVVEPTLNVDKAITNVAYANADPTDNPAATVTYTVTIENTSGVTAHNVSLKDVLPEGVTNYTVIEVQTSEDGVGAISPDPTTSDLSDYSIEFLGNDASVTITYTVDFANRLELPDSTPAEVEWTSLSDGGESLTDGSVVSEAGGSGTASGERTGSDKDSGPNNYYDQDRNDFSSINGKIWDDTWHQDGVYEGGPETPLAGLVVQLQRKTDSGDWENWLETTTNEAGDYTFTALPPGEFRVVIPENHTATIDGDTDHLVPNWDTDHGTDPGVIVITVGEGETQTDQNFTYLRENDKPKLTVGDKESGIEIQAIEAPNNDGDTFIPPVQLLDDVWVFDRDLGVDETPDNEAQDPNAIFGAGSITVTLDNARQNDVLQLAADGISGYDENSVTYVFNDATKTGTFTIELTETTTLAQVKAILESIQYAHGGDDPTDRLPGDSERTSINFTVTLNDGNNSRGDNKDSGTGGPLEADVTGKINLVAVNDPPVAVHDTNETVRTDTNDPSGNVITGHHTSGKGDTKTEGTDYDPDTPEGDLRLTTIKVTTPEGEDGTLDFGDPYEDDDTKLVLKGKYGDLHIDAKGNYEYVVDQNNPAVYGLDSGDSLVEEFEYTLTDGETPDTELPTATLTITIHGDDIDPPSISPVDHTSDIDGHNIVHETGLRPESEIDADTGEKFAIGTINVDAPGGIKSVVIGGEIIELDALNDASDTSPITIYSDTAEDGSVWKLEIIGFVPGELEAGTPEPDSAPRVGEITYRFTLLQPIENDEDADHHDEDISLTVTDQADQHTDGTLTIRIIDDEPEAVADEKTVDNDTDTATGNALDNDTLGADRGVFVTDITGPDDAQGVADSDGIITVEGKHGTLVIQPDGEFTYTRHNGEPLSATEVFTYTITDADGDTSEATITIHIEDAGPQVTDGSGTPPAKEPVDPDDPTGEQRWVIKPDGSVNESGLSDGSTSGDNSQITTGTINFDKGDGVGDEHTVTITGKDGSPVELTGTPDQEIETPYGTVTITEFDPENGTIEYTYELKHPSQGDNTADEFEVTIEDKDGDTTRVTVVIDIVDDEPEAVADEKTVDNDTDTATGNALDNDTLGADRGVFVTDITGPDDAQGVADSDGIITVEGKHGTLVIQPDGEFTYTRHNGEPLSATEVFTYTITDADGDTSEATITIHIEDAGPQVTDGSGTPPAKEPVDPDDPTGEQRWVIKPDGSVNESGLPDGSTSGDNSQITTGTINFDKGDGNGDEHTVTITGKDGSPVELTGTPDQEIETPYGTVTITEFDPENGTIKYTYELKHPSQGDNTTDEFEVTIEDKDGDTTSVTVVIDIINDDPVANPDTSELTFGDEDTVSGNVFDNDNIGADGEPDDGPVTGITQGSTGTPTDGVNQRVNGLYGTITIDSNGNYTYEPDPDNNVLNNLPGGENVEEVFTYTITDSDGDTSTATLTITIHGNTPPVAEPDTLRIPEDSVGTGNVLDNDGDDDGDELKVNGFTIDGIPGDQTPGVPVDIPGVGTITIDEDGNYTFTPIKDWNGEVPVITYTVTDGKGERGTTTSTLTITVTPVPDAFDDKVSTESGMPVTFDPTGNDTFSNPDKKITEVTHGNNGTVTITPDGRITYTPNPGFEGTDTFTYTVTSGGITETATVTVNVRGQHIDVPPPAFGDYTPPSMAPEVTGSPLTRSVVRDTSVFFQDEAFDRVDRMQLPFHPIAYVNRQVQVAQDERMATDVRFFSNPSMAQPGEVQSRSIGAGLGADPNLFVQHAVRDTQTRADFLARVIDGRLGRIGLSSDWILPTPDLFQADPGRLVPGATPAPETEPARQDDTLPQEDAGPQDGAPGNADAAPDTNNAGAGQGDTAAALSRLDGSADQPDMAADQIQASLIGRGAPSFTEQLKGGSARLPATLFTPHRDV